MTKRLIWIFAALLLMCSPALAVWRGTLSGSIATTFTLTNGAGNPGPAGATICFLVPATKHLGPSEQCQPLTAQSGTGAQLTLTALPAGTKRVIVDVDIPNGGGGVGWQVTQSNGTNFQDQFTVDSRFVYDVGP